MKPIGLSYRVRRLYDSLYDSQEVLKAAWLELPSLEICRLRKKVGRTDASAPVEICGLRKNEGRHMPTDQAPIVIDE